MSRCTATVSKQVGREEVVGGRGPNPETTGGGNYVRCKRALHLTAAINGLERNLADCPAVQAENIEECIYAGEK